MKLKLVAAMSVLGIIGSSAFAHETHALEPNQPPVSQPLPTSPQPVVPPHHQHHRVVKHIEHDYKDELPVEPAPVEVCTLSQTDLILESVTQNAGRSLPNPCNPGWFNRIQWSGGVNVDLGKFGNRNANLMGENYQVISLNDAYLNISAIVNDWARAFASISYNTATLNEPFSTFFDRHVAEYSNAYDGIPLSDSFFHGLQLEQAYFTVGNFEVYPLYIQVGKQFQDFSRYEIHPITRSLTQVMSESLAVSAKLGFISLLGFNGSIFVFDDPIRKINRTTYPVDYGISIGFEQTICNWGWDLGAAYLYDLMGVNDIAYNVAQFTILQGNGLRFHRRTGGVAVYGDFNYGPFVLAARWTTAVQRFNPLDLPRHGIADTDQITGVVDPGASGAKPWSAGVQAAYVFDGLWDMTQHVYIGYQTSREAGGLQLPKHRYLAGVGIAPWPNTEFTLEWVHDNAFNRAYGGSGKGTNLVTIRTDVKFG